MAPEVYRIIADGGKVGGVVLKMESGCLGHELIKFFQSDPARLPSVFAFIQQRAKLRPEAFRYLLEHFHQSFPTKKYLGKYSFIAADGSEFNIAYNPNDPSTFFPPSGKSKKGFNAIHTVLIAAHQDVRTVSNRLGHAQASTTMNIYTHALKENDRTASNALESRLSKTGE